MSSESQATEIVSWTHMLHVVGSLQHGMECGMEHGMEYEMDDVNVVIQGMC